MPQNATFQVEVLGYYCEFLSPNRNISISNWDFERYLIIVSRWEWRTFEKRLILSFRESNSFVTQEILFKRTCTFGSCERSKIFWSQIVRCRFVSNWCYFAQYRWNEHVIRETQTFGIARFQSLYRSELVFGFRVLSLCLINGNENILRNSEFMLPIKGLSRKMPDFDRLLSPQMAKFRPEFIPK